MRGWGNTMSLIGRLRAGVSLEDAGAEFAVLLPQLKESHPDWAPGLGAQLTGLQDKVTRPVRRSMLVLWIGVGVVLLIVCTNLSNLLLARASTRSREFAVRTAVGAPRGRLIRQLLTEGVILSGTGGLLGIGLAYGSVQYLLHSARLSLPLLDRITAAWRVVVFTAGLSILTGLLFATLPALRTLTSDRIKPLHAGRRGSTSGQEWARSTLIVAEIGMACTLLFGAGLLLRSFLRLLDQDLGFRPSGAIAVRVDSPANSTPEQLASFLSEAAGQVRALPGVEAAGFTDALPLDRNRSWGLAAVGRQYGPGENRSALVTVIGPGYLHAMGIPVLEGRGFNAGDTADAPPVLLINQAAARFHWPGEDPLGKLAFVNGTEEQYQVVGVVADVPSRTLEEGGDLEFYRPMAQQGPVSTELIIRTKLALPALISSVREALGPLQPDLPASDFRPLDELIERAVSPRRLVTSLVTAFAVLALVLASLGIYGVVSYSAAQRRLEFGIRIALGAPPARIRLQVVQRTLLLVCAGIALGILGSLVVSSLVASLLFRVEPADPVNLVATFGTLAVSALIAAYLPALRASRVNPVTALRAE